MLRMPQTEQRKTIATVITEKTHTPNTRALLFSPVVPAADGSAAAGVAAAAFATEPDDPTTTREEEGEEDGGGWQRFSKIKSRMAVKNS